MKTNQNTEIKEGWETALANRPGSAWTLRYLPVCIRGTDERTQSKLDPPGAFMPSAHTQNSHSLTRETPHLSAQELQASPDQRLPPRPRPSSHLYPDAKSVPAACQPRAKWGKPEDTLKLGEHRRKMRTEEARTSSYPHASSFKTSGPLSCLDVSGFDKRIPPGCTWLQASPSHR